jgi:hypothetical protein
MWPKVIEKRRQQYTEAQYLSDWQIHSAHLTAGAIKFTYDGYEEGPYFVPMPTGSGKTTGAIWGIIELLEEAPAARLCFFTPYIEAVEDIYEKVSKYLGPKIVGRYHSDGIEDKSSALQKRVVILTHQFLSYNPADLLADRDLFIVDEALYATGEATLKLSDVAKAREWAEANNVMAGEFVQLYDYANSLDRKLRESGKKHVAGEKPESSDWVVEIATNLTLSNHSQSISDHSLLSATIRFCEALLAGMVFVSKTTTHDDTSNPTFSAAVFGIPNIEKTVVLSATGGLLYSIAGPFKQDSGSRHHWSHPNYANLTLTQLIGPALPSTYSHWNNDTAKQKVIEYLDWLLQQIPETNLYLTFPKSVVDKALRSYFNQPERGDLDYPYVTTKHGKRINVSHHAVSIGSNKFKECDAVLYLWDNHLPSSVAIQRFHILSDEPVTDESLKDANKSRLLGNYERIREAQYLDSMMQHIGRGNVRNIDADQNVGHMTAYVLARKPDLFTRLATYYRGSQLSELQYTDQDTQAGLSRMGQILDYLLKHGKGREVPTTEIEGVLGFSIRRYADDLEENFELMCLGYEYRRGGRGRGKSAAFVYKRQN